MIKKQYIDWLVSWIQNGTVNIKTGQPFKAADIINPEYKAEVEARLVVSE
jgi:hypothetical protein